jgi:electron transfer flavoprotein alpha/beta subunit
MLGLEGSPTRVVKIASPPGRAAAAEMIHADSADQAASELAEKLVAAKVL